MTRPADQVTLAEHSLAVLCGTDEAYEGHGVAAAAALKAAGVTHLLVAGRPANMDALKAAGVDGFLYAGGDLAAVLSRCLEVLA